MPQPVSSSNYKHISGTAAGTTVISNQECSFNSVTFGGNYTGTLTFYDCDTEAGTTTANLLISVNNNSGSIPTTFSPAVQTNNGLTVVIGGTTDALVGYSA